MLEEKILLERPFAFRAWRAYPAVMSGPHTHTDIELNLLLSGSATYFLAGRFHELVPGRLAVFWGGMPHRLTRVGPQTEYLCMTLPLAWFLAWNMDTRFTQCLLAGDLIVEPDSGRAQSDEVAFQAWTVDTRSNRWEETRIALLEVEARLRRLAMVAPARSPLPGNGIRREGGAVHGQQMERMASFIGERYGEPITVETIAGAVGLSPTYAMSVFKEGCGLSLWEYVTRLRISHAQRLLLTTDWTVERIALDCGFGSASRFFPAFKRLCGTTPRQYRLR